MMRLFVIFLAFGSLVWGSVWTATWKDDIREAIVAYEAIAQDGGWPTVDMNTTLQLGDSHPQLPSLIQRLKITGDYVGSDPLEPTFFDGRVEEAIKKFQRRHGIRPDGRLGLRTLKEINIPVDIRLKQLRTTWQERYRFVPPASRFLLVNIPSAHLEVIDKGGAVLTMKAAVGRPERPTPLLVGPKVRTAVFHPTWTLPETIIVEDMPKKLQKNPALFIQKGIRVFRNDTEIDPENVAWQKLTKEQWMSYRFVQEAGENNPLGEVKFLFANKDHIYLHDTSDHAVFQKSLRYVSSGCVRLEKPEALVRYFFGEEFVPPTEDNTYLPLPKPVPLAIVYWTAWVDLQGVVHFRPDIYNRLGLGEPTTARKNNPLKKVALR